MLMSTLVNQELFDVIMDEVGLGLLNWSKVVKVTRVTQLLFNCSHWQ